MLPKSIRVALVLAVAACLLLLIYSQTWAQTQVQSDSIRPPVLQERASARSNASPTLITVIYTQPPNGALLQQQSSQFGYSRYGSDYDQYIWDDFTLSFTREITEVAWRGIYNTGGNPGGAVIDFSVAVYTSTAANTQPDHLSPPLMEYTIGGNASETPPWTPTGVTPSTHDYTFTLPAPFTATAGIKYWVQIEAIQNGPTDWGIVAGTGGDNSHFYAIPAAGDFYFNTSPGDAAFTLLGPPTEIYFTYLPLILKQ